MLNLKSPVFIETCEWTAILSYSELQRGWRERAARSLGIYIEMGKIWAPHTKFSVFFSRDLRPTFLYYRDDSPGLISLSSDVVLLAYHLFICGSQKHKLKMHGVISSFLLCFLG